jgi:hypothetical protein
MLENATGYKVANLGLHAGFKPLFYTELSKANINPGDIVLLAYEDSWYKEGAFESIGTELVMSGIDNDIEMYKYLPVRTWGSLLGYMYSYAYKKNTFTAATGQYSREAFDPITAQMTYPRNYIMSDYRSKVDDYGSFDVSNAEIGNDVVKYLQSYKKYVESCGAEVYFVSCPHLLEAMKCEYGDYDSLKQQEIDKIGIPYISNPSDYMFPETLMANSIYHCNTRGEKYRTMLLIQDLVNAGLISNDDLLKYLPAKDDQIIFINDLSKYISAIKDPSYTIFLTINGECESQCISKVKDYLSKLGVQTDFINAYNNNCIAIIKNS